MPPSLFLALAKIIDIYTAILFFRIIMTWVLPYHSWHKQPMALLYQITEPAMAPFRRLVPPIGGLDFSPVLLFMALQLLSTLLRQLAFVG